MKNTIFIIIGLITVISCTDAKQAKFGGLGDRYKIELVNCDGSVTHAWISTGKIGKNSNAYYFKDEKSGTLIEVSGTLIISKL